VAYNLNAIPMYSRFNPANVTPRTRTALPDKLCLSSYMGYADLNLGSSHQTTQLQFIARWRHGADMSKG